MRTKRLTHSVWVMAPLSAVLLWTGCVGNPTISKFGTPESVAAAEICAEYRADADSVRTLEHPKGCESQSKMDLRQDGTFTFDCIANDWLLTTSAHIRAEKVFGSGTWKVLPREEFMPPTILLRFTESAGADIPYGAGPRLAILGRRGPYSLYLVIGDPDANVGIIYVRASIPSTRQRSSRP